MRIVPVIDLQGGLVVRGVAGRRNEYRPIESRLCLGAEVGAIAQALHEAFDFAECYIADLDAIAGGEPSFVLYEQVIAAGFAPWIDAGTATPAKAAAVAEFLASRAPCGRVIVGLESLAKLDMLAEIGRLIGFDRLVFSLDLKAGWPLSSDTYWSGQSPAEIAAHAVALGVRRLIVLDLAGVGVGQGVPTLELCRTLRARHPEVELTSGGGVRNPADLRTMAASGCDAALVASALHDGRITREILQNEF